MNQSNPKKISPQDLDYWLRKPADLPFLVDVREAQEIALAAFPASVLHLPLSQSSIWMHSLADQLPQDQPVVVICHAGIRSWNFGMWLIENSFGCEVWNLEGGIDAWSVEVDPEVPRY